jgi:hypothetical protein
MPAKRRSPPAALVFRTHLCSQRPLWPRWGVRPAMIVSDQLAPARLTP